MAPQIIAIIGAGIFVKSQYLPRLAEISDLVSLKCIWSRSQKSALEAVEAAKNVFPSVECKYGDDGLDEIVNDTSIVAVIVALAGQIQVDMSLKLLKAGKHVLQEKPAAASISELETALSSYNSLHNNQPTQNIWAVAENYRFEPAFVESRKLVSEIGDMMSVQVIIEGSMNSSNPYFSSSWRRNFTGGFILDMGVHYIAGLRMMVGCEVASVSAMTSHVDMTLPPPDTISSIFQLENGCSGVFVMLVSSRSPKIIWRVVGLSGTVQVERGNKDGRHGYVVTLFSAKGETTSTFYPFSGVTEELKAFLSDVSKSTLQGSKIEAEARCSFVEGARDVAVLDAMLESGIKQGASVMVKKF
ncbi:NAD(P)-binding Rossmann-fold superfamily protein [Artemisia annua]|uniref:NAD(P)-binding Rossmann-fold superfamily protein n=1 Tax=Artemisia annua TaxID=35608 RepID=A0A2U1KNQ8_ARTAN|nr:NAD(P)-binding Rossmann-fold superfamily protein [Artemisia annua]